MNKRIKKLVKQATEDVIRNTPSFLVTNEMWQEKFAELIVLECIDNVKLWEKDSRNHISYLLEQHFGVKE